MNQAINFFWTILCFTPVIGFWLGTNSMQLLYLLILIACISLFIPGRFLQLSSDPKFYEKLGVRFIRKVVQNGDYAKKLSRRAFPQTKIIKNRADAGLYQRTILMYERYHFLCFTLFLLSSVYALLIQSFIFLGLIFIANIIYNICPILLQQYNRVRILKVVEKRETHLS